MDGFMEKSRKEKKNIPIMWLLVLVFVPVFVATIFVMGTIFRRLSYKQVTDSSRVSMVNALKQSTSMMDNRMEDMMERFQYIESSSDLSSLALLMGKENADKTRSQYYINLRKNIDDQLMLPSSFLESVMINFNDGKFQIYGCTDIPMKIKFDYEEWYREKKAVYNWRFLHDDMIFQVAGAGGGPKHDQVFSLYRLYGSPGQCGRGGMVFNIKESMFRNLLSIPEISENSYVALIHDGESICSREISEEYRLQEETLERLERDKDISDGMTFKSLTGRKMMVYSKKLKSTGWAVAAVLPADEMFQDVRTMQRSILIIMAALMACSVMLCVALSRKIAGPIKKLADDVSVADVTSIRSVSIGGTREMQILSGKINELLEKVWQLFRQVKEEQEKKRETELSLMREQINPHFLYNTLYSVQQLCELGEGKEASEMVLALSNFFRTGLSRGDDIISIETEMNHVRNYLFIQHMKYGDKFEYEINVDKEIASCQILRLTLQPIVENALYHGIQARSGQGEIFISAREKEERIELEVADTGAGMSGERLAQVIKSINQDPEYAHVSFGLRNVNSRLLLYYKGDSRMEIESNEGRGTSVRVFIPKRMM